MVQAGQPPPVAPGSQSGGDGDHPVELGRRGQDVAAVLWPSFLVACVGTMVVFALFDPADLAAIVGPDLSFAPMTGYAAGFFLLWVMTAASSLVTLYMIRTAHRTERQRDRSGGKY